MPINPNDPPGSGLDKAPAKSLKEKIADTVNAVLKPAKNTEKDRGGEIQRAPKTNQHLAIRGLLDSDLPAGFAYRPDVISVSDEQALARKIESLPFKPFEFHGYLGNRRIVSYGHRYDYGKQSLQKSEPLPDWITPLKCVAADFLGVAAETLQQALVTEYAPGAGIGWHRDKPMFAHVVAISFLAPCIQRFRRSAGGNWLRQKQQIAPRSAYVLSGEARDVWEHSITPMDYLRYSITFRDFRTPK